jgi:hypothetical protein
MIKNFNIKKITKTECKSILEEYHYLSKINKGFRCGYNFGLFTNNVLVGVCVFHSPSVPETVKGCFSLNRDQQEGIFELGRLCLRPNITQKNILSWFISKCIKLLRKEITVRALLSYADSSFHNGYIYQATNFGYYGLTDKKKDFWFDNGDGTYTKHQRGPVKGFKGEWRPRARKHRYLLIYDSNLKCKWGKFPYPKEENKSPLNKKPTPVSVG